MPCKTYDLPVKVRSWVVLRSCKGDGGRSSETALQGEVSNHRKLLWSKAMVVSVAERAQ